MNREARITQSWTDNAPAWVKAVREGLIPSRIAGTDAAVVELVLQSRPRTVLDAGCGEGWLARALAHNGVDVTGMDGSVQLIEQAQQSGGARFLKLSYDEFSTRPDTAGAEFDVVVFNFSLFAADIVPVLRAARSVLSAQGRLIIQTIHPFNDAQDTAYEDGWREESFAGMSGGFTTSMPWYFRTMESWTRAVTEAGFQLLELREPLNRETGRPLSLILMAKP